MGGKHGSYGAGMVQGCSADPLARKGSYNPLAQQSFSPVAHSSTVPPPLQAIPIMNEALAALDTIKEADITYIKKLGNPPAAIKLVLEAVCVILDAKPAKVGVGDGVWRPSAL